MTETSATVAPAAPPGGLSALRYPIFRKIWLGSLVSNLGLMIQGVGAAWAMTQLTKAADLVALVQTAAMLPSMLLSIAAGAVADMYDRRIVAMVAMGVSFTGASALAIFSLLGLLTPWTLLGFCFVIGVGMALFGPAWASSVSEQVPAEHIAPAVAMNSISFNIARSFGPAVGGLIVAAAGAAAAFAVNALCYVPLFIVYLLWKRKPSVARLPPERLERAMVSGIRYVLNSPQIRVVLIRSVILALIAGALSGLMPLVARDLIGGGAPTYGLLLGAYGMGAVGGALAVGRVRNALSSETIARLCVVLLGLATVVVAASHTLLLSLPALFVAGGAWMISVTVLNIGVQLPSPRWVTGRSVASFQTALAGGMALGSWAWGHVADAQGVRAALYIAGAMMVLSALAGLVFKLPTADASAKDEADMLADPEVRMAITGRSGPIVIEIEYRIELSQARSFHGLMQTLQMVRQRNGAYGWSIARDVADPELWTERYHTPTWMDYLRQRSRSTQFERDLIQQAVDRHIGPEPVRIKRMLERPFGSVRWKDEAPDQGADGVLPVT